VDEGLETNHVHEDKITKAVSAPCTRSDTIRPTHHRTVSIPSTPVFPGMYPRVRALRREALENNLQRNMALGTAREYTSVLHF
jgi:hypothetical protein